MHRWPGWRCDHGKSSLVVGQLEGVGNFSSMCLRRFVSTLFSFPFRDAKKNSGGKKVAFAIIFRFLDAFLHDLFLSSFDWKDSESP